MASEEVLHSFTMPAAEAVRNTTLGALAGAGTDLQDTWTWVYTEWAGEDALFLWTGETLHQHRQHCECNCRPTASTGYTMKP